MATDPQQLLRALRKINLWFGLSDEELLVIYRACSSVEASAGETIFNEGDPSHDLYILLSGRVEIVTQKKGVIHTFTANESFGEIGLITQNTRSASAQATETSKLLALNHAEFNRLLGTHPRISALMMRNITTSLSEHIVRMNQAELEYAPSSSLTKELQDSTSLVLTPDSAFKY